MNDLRPQLSPRESEWTCAFCLAPAEAGQEWVPCAGCGVVYHPECIRDELRTCASLGCAGEFPAEIMARHAEVNHLGFLDAFALSAQYPRRNYYACGCLSLLPGLLAALFALRAFEAGVAVLGLVALPVLLLSLYFGIKVIRRGWRYPLR